MFAARNDHWNRFIEPALLAGSWVVCDRFADSSYAYQGYGKNVCLTFLRTLYQNTVGDIVPDRTYLFDVPTNIGLERARKRMTSDQIKEDRFEGLGSPFHERVRTGFNELAKAEPQRFCNIDGSQSIEVLESLVLKDIECLISATALG